MILNAKAVPDLPWRERIFLSGDRAARKRELARILDKHGVAHMNQMPNFCGECWSSDSWVPTWPGGGGAIAEWRKKAHDYASRTLQSVDHATFLAEIMRFFAENVDKRWTPVGRIRRVLLKNELDGGTAVGSAGYQHPFFLRRIDDRWYFSWYPQ